MRSDELKPTVLVIDDDPLFLTMTRDALKEEGYAVTTAPDGDKGLEALEERSFEAFSVTISPTSVRIAAGGRNTILCGPSTARSRIVRTLCPRPPS